MTAFARNRVPGARNLADQSGSRPTRYFVGLELLAQNFEIQAALIRVTGRGLTSDIDVVDTATSRDPRIRMAMSTNADGASPVATLSEAAQAAYLTEAASEIIQSITSTFSADDGCVLACALHGFGVWLDDPIDGFHFLPRCDTSLLSKNTGLTIIDDLPGRDLAYGGHGGPVEAAGIWMLLADRGRIPGRRIRAVIQLDESLRLTLLPPRQPIQIPTHLICHELAPGQAFLNAIVHQLVDDSIADPHGKLAVQGRHRPTLLRRWEENFDQTDLSWSPQGLSPEPWLATLRDWSKNQSITLHDALCTAIHLLADRLARHIQHDLPRSQPVGQLVLAGAGRENAFFVRELQHRLPELDIVRVDDEQTAPAAALGAAATAVLAQLHLDQIPGNSSALTGTDVPRILGRLTPGNPANWHEVLANMAETLPEKQPLRSAV